jgi:hypothetical protein
MQTDKSKITQEELRRYGITELDNMTITIFKLLLDKRIELADSDFTTMSDAEWIRDFRKALVELMDAKDAMIDNAVDKQIEESQDVRKLQSYPGYLANL